MTSCQFYRSISSCQNQGHTDGYMCPVPAWDTCSIWMTVQKHMTSAKLHGPYNLSHLPFSQLAPAQPVKQWQRKSPFLSSQRTVPLGLQGDGEHWSGISTNVSRQEVLLKWASTNRMHTFRASHKKWEVTVGAAMKASDNAAHLNIEKSI